MVARHNLLVVDDEADVVQSLQDLLRFEYRVLGATRTDEAFRILEREDVHLVMTDQRMPDMTGVEFLRRLRDLRPEAIRLLFTGYADIQAVIDAINQGNVYRYISKPWDVSELQGFLRQAAEHYDLLAERKRLLAELQEKNRQLEAANHLKEAFIKVASHELRTPVTIVLGLADLARQSPGLPEPLRQRLERIYGGGQRLHRLVDQMVKLLQVGRFERPLAREDVALGDLLGAAADDVAPFVEQRQQTLAVDAPPDLGTVAVEPDKLRDSVAHLLLNAVKFTADGGRIRLAARRLPDGGAEIRVTDTGVGIEPANLSRVFDPFFTRFDVSRHSSGVFEFDRRGLGLGLSVVKGFVEMHGGQVRAESHPGQGSTFIITLPPQPQP
jgi:signal transduction histidine kinase